MTGEQGSLIFHDTVPLPSEQLEQAIETAKKQRLRVLSFFAKYPESNWTPAEVHFVLVGEDIQRGIRLHILLTSVRRTITNLTKEGRLIKCQWSEGRQGRYGRYNRTWKYRTDYLSPLNLR